MGATTPEASHSTQREVPADVSPGRAAVAEFRVGVRKLPYLADHGFQGMVVLPGSFFMDAALRLDRDASQRTPRVLRNVAFLAPVVLSADDTLIMVEAIDRGDGRVEYAFHEASADENIARMRGRRHAASLEVDRCASVPSAGGKDGFSIDAFQARSEAVIDGERFYGRLRDNGNEYGPRFRNVSSIWRAGDQCLGRVVGALRHGDADPHVLHPCLLDSVTQLMAPFVMESGRTFVLKGIDRIEMFDFDFPDTLWVHATAQTAGDAADAGMLGSLRVFDALGKRYLDLSGVALSLLDRVDVPDEAAAAKLVVASSFTAEPIEDTLGFWGDHFGERIRAEFTPYNQIFQQLLDPGSAFRQNGQGANAILLGLEDWATGDRRAPLALSAQKAARCFGHRARHVLPNGLEVVHLNGYETDYVYKEIFEDECYLKHGIRLRDGDTVLDIGANIGLFSLFVMTRCRDPRIYACEPAPVVHDLLKANCEAYGGDVRALNVGVSDRRRTATFTFYENSSVFSGFHSDEAEDREAIRAVVRNMLNAQPGAGGSVEQLVDEFTADRLRRSTYECQVVSVSDIIRDHAIERIDLIKIDAEKSELDILEGIEEGDWPRIRQIVVEVHDPTGEAIRQIERRLTNRGFRCAVEQEPLLERAGLFNLFATRGDVRAEATETVGTGARGREVQRAADSLRRNVGEFSGALRSFMGQSKVPLILCLCPRTPAAQADEDLAPVLDRAEQALLSEVSGIAGVRAIGSSTILRRYPMRDYYDPLGHRAGHIPYTPECYAAIGTELVRTLLNSKRTPFKVIALDCDNTLWKGVCGEDGPLGVEVSAPYRALQEFMLARANAGMLLCLCSKNNEEDVLEVFRRRADMPLKLGNLVSWRLNWTSKSANLRALAEELALGLDSFIFIDDNPVECAEVRGNCPEVLTLQLPSDPEATSRFLDHVWAFDGGAATVEDRGRTRMYQESAQRERFRESAFSLEDFVKGLELRVEIAELTDDQVGRVSQLTYRTNQFNFTTVRRSESEIREFLRDEHARCLVVHVVDRFGDYGLVGVLMYRAQSDRFGVDTFLLSCRVLGRGVEHAVVAHLGRVAREQGRRFVEFVYERTAKNQPALEFIRRVGGPYANETGTAWTIPAESLASVEYDPVDSTQLTDKKAEATDAGQPATRRSRGLGDASRSVRLQRIAEDLSDIDRLASAVEAHRRRNQAVDATPDAIPGNALETTLANLWRKVLGRSQIGMNENFFEAGGTSLRAVQLIALIKKDLDQNLSIVTLFECPTVRLLAARLGAVPGETGDPATGAAAARRGQQRRQGALRRRAS